MGRHIIHIVNQVLNR